MWDVGVKNESLMGAGFKGVGFRFFSGIQRVGLWGLVPRATSCQ